MTSAPKKQKHSALTDDHLGAKRVELTPKQAARLHTYSTRSRRATATVKSKYEGGSRTERT